MKFSLLTLGMYICQQVHNSGKQLLYMSLQIYFWKCSGLGAISITSSPREGKITTVMIKSPPRYFDNYNFGVICLLYITPNSQKNRVSNTRRHVKSMNLACNQCQDGIVFNYLNHLINIPSACTHSHLCLENQKMVYNPFLQEHSHRINCI